MTMATRRTTLAMLGLGPAAAIGAESFIAGPIDGPAAIVGSYQAEVWARALRSLADQIEAGTVSTVRLDVSASLVADDFLKHTLSLEFFYEPDTNQS